MHEKLFVKMTLKDKTSFVVASFLVTFKNGHNSFFFNKLFIKSVKECITNKLYKECVDLSFTVNCPLRKKKICFALYNYYEEVPSVRQSDAWT